MWGQLAQVVSNWKTKPSTSNSNQKVAVLFIGNAGAGKSTLLTQIGGNFKSGAIFWRGYTKDVTERTISLRGEEVVLVNVPGLFEPDDKQTRFNCKKLTEALNKPYDYWLFFVLKALNGGPDNVDMVMMAKVNECIQWADGGKVTFRVIVNQIVNEQVRQLYQENVARDNFQKLFTSLRIHGFSFDINIDCVILLNYDKDAVEQNTLQDTIAKEVLSHKAVPLSLEKELSVVNETLVMFKKAQDVLKSSEMPGNGRDQSMMSTTWEEYSGSPVPIFHNNCSDAHPLKTDNARQLSTGNITMLSQILQFSASVLGSNAMILVYML